MLVAGSADHTLSLWLFRPIGDRYSSANPEGYKRLANEGGAVGVLLQHMEAHNEMILDVAFSRGFVHIPHENRRPAKAWEQVYGQGGGRGGAEGGMASRRSADDAAQFEYKHKNKSSSSWSYAPAANGRISRDVMFASSSWDRNVCVYSLRRGEGLVLEAHKAAVRSIDFSPSIDDSRGVLLVSGSDDHIVLLWNVAEGSVLHRFDAHSDSIFSVCFSPKGDYIASGSMDQSLCISSTFSGEEIVTMRSHAGKVVAVCFTHDGTAVISAGDDKSVRKSTFVSSKQTSTLLTSSGEWHQKRVAKTFKLSNVDHHASPPPDAPSLQKEQYPTQLHPPPPPPSALATAVATKAKERMLTKGLLEVITTDDMTAASNAPPAGAGAAGGRGGASEGMGMYSGGARRSSLARKNRRATGKTMVATRRASIGRAKQGVNGGIMGGEDAIAEMGLIKGTPKDLLLATELVHQEMRKKQLEAEQAAAKNSDSEGEEDVDQDLEVLVAEEQEWWKEDVKGLGAADMRAEEAAFAAAAGTRTKGRRGSAIDIIGAFPKLGAGSSESVEMPQRAESGGGVAAAGTARRIIRTIIHTARSIR
jgi:hypothetical protein